MSRTAVAAIEVVLAAIEVLLPYRMSGTAGRERAVARLSDAPAPPAILQPIQKLQPLQPSQQLQCSTVTTVTAVTKLQQLQPLAPTAAQCATSSHTRSICTTNPCNQTMHMCAYNTCPSISSSKSQLSFALHATPPSLSAHSPTRNRTDASCSSLTSESPSFAGTSKSCGFSDAIPLPPSSEPPDVLLALLACLQYDRSGVSPRRRAC